MVSYVVPWITSNGDFKKPLYTSAGVWEVKPQVQEKQDLMDLILWCKMAFYIDYDLNITSILDMVSCP